MAISSVYSNHVNNNNKNIDIDKIRKKNTNWLLGVWALLESFMCKQNSQKKSTVDNVIDWHQLNLLTSQSSNIFFSILQQPSSRTFNERHAPRIPIFINLLAD